MKRFFLFSVILLTLFGWTYTEAQAQLGLTIDVPAGPQNTQFDVTFTFSEMVDVTATRIFDASDITLSPPGLATLGTVPTGAGPAFVVPITPEPGQQGELTITVPVSVAVGSVVGIGNVMATATVQVDTVAPTVTITPPSGTQPGEFDVTIDFGEAVNGFTDDDITLSAGARVSSLTGSNGDSSYTATIAPKFTGAVAISVAASVATDAAGNDNEASTLHTVTVDLPHAIMVMEPDEEGPYSAAFDVMIMFTESVGAFTASDITLTPTSSLATVTNVTGTAPTYIATITPKDSQTGDLEIKIAAGDVQDAAPAPMDYPASNEIEVMIDTVRPTTTIDDIPSDTQNGAFDITIEFTENVYGFDPTDDIDFGGTARATATLKSGNDGDAEYEVTITPTRSGNLTIDVSGNAAADAAGNKSALSNQASVTIDQDAPEVTISNAPASTQNSAFDVTITFDETVTGFDADAVTLSPSGLATVTDVSAGSNNSYMVEITPEDDEQGDLTISVAAGAVQDTPGNDNDASNEVTVTVDKKGPTVVFSGTPNTPQNAPFDITITFSEDVTGFAAADIDLSPNTLATVMISGSGAAYMAEITPNTNQEGTIVVTITNNAVTDTAGNPIITTDAARPKIDTIVPTVAITPPSGEQKNPFDVTITFSEDVTDFSKDDLAITGEATATATSGGPKVYTATITPNANKEGDVTVKVDANTVKDAAENDNTASNTATIPIDTMAPTVAISGAPAAHQKAPFDLTITFSETVTDFEAGDITLSPSGLATVSFTGSGPYTATITPTDDEQGELTISVAAGVAEDAAENGNDASNEVTVAVDKKKPTVTFDVPTTPQTGEFEVTITFSEDVTGFATEDITLSDTNLASVVVSGSGPYTATITPEDRKEGNLTLTVNANAVTDTAGHANLESDASDSISIDTQVPVIYGWALPNVPQNSAFVIRINLDERATGLAADDITLTPSGLATVTNVHDGSPLSKRVNITPSANMEGDLTVTVRAGAVMDTAGNENAAVTSDSIAIDTIKPTVAITGVPSGKQKDPFDLTFTFSEGVDGFAPEDDLLDLQNQFTASVKSGTDGGDVYVVTIAPNANLDATIGTGLDAGTVTDLAGNTNDASDTLAFQIDTKKPTITISNPPSGPQKVPVTLTITFSENVTGFLSTDITLSPSGLATTALAGQPGGSVYHAIIAPSNGKQGTLTISVGAGVVVDGPGNGNAASDSVTLVVDNKKPTASFSGVPNTPQKDPFNVTITFSEDVNGFAAEDVTVAGEATVTNVDSPGNDEYILTITPNANKEGDVTLQVAANTVTDAAGNANTASTVTAPVRIDTIAPTVILIANVPATEEQNGAFVVTVFFNEAVNDFAAADVTVTGEATVTRVGSPDNDEYTVTITPNANKEGDVTLQIKANAVTDTAGNANTAASTVTAAIHIDTIVPTVTSITGVPNTEQNEAFDITVTFSEDVTGFAADDVTVTGEATVTNVDSPDANEYVLTITPNANKEGDVTLQVDANAVTDNAGNANPASAVTSAVHIDTIVPTATVTPPSGEQKDPFDVTITFSEAVDGFQQGDITLTGEATLTALTGSDGDSEYTARITPDATSEDDVTVQVDANTVTDAAGNANTAASNTASIHIDTIVPTVTITGLPSGEQNGPFDITVTFSEDVTGFAVDDFTVTGEATVAFKSFFGATEFTLTVTPNAEKEGDVTLQVNASTVTDLAGNPNTASAVTDPVHIDTIAPTLEITGLPDQTVQDNTPISEAIDVTFTFSEPVNGFEPGDIFLAGTYVSVSLKSGTDGDSVYVVTFTPDANIDNTITFRFASDRVQDEAGNGNEEVDWLFYPIDTLPPTVTISDAPEIEKNVPFDLTITFDEVVDGFEVGDLTVTGPASAGSLSAGTVNNPNSDDEEEVYTVTITPDADEEGDVTVQVDANTVTDDASNANDAASNTVSVHVDTIDPTVTISAPPTAEQKDPFDLTVTFSEEVNGFAADDLTVTGPAEASLTSGDDGDAEYTVTITPDTNEEGDVTVQVNANTVQDLALNDNTASAVTDEVHIDTIVPTVEISAPPTAEQKDPFDLLITFSESVEGFAADDVTVTGPATATLAGGVTGDEVYRVTITPDLTSEGDVTVQVNAGAAQDPALNDNTASDVSDTVHVDTIVPTVSISGEPIIEENDPFDITITFSEPVNGFAVPADLTVTGPATASLASGSDTDSVYTVTITPNATSEGDVTVTVNANTVQDFALNDNTASSVSTTVHVDTIVPTVAITGAPTIEENDPFVLTVTFSEPVNGFAVPADLTVTGPATASLTTGTDGAAEYTVTITPNPTSEGDVTVTVNANAVQDFALNANTAASAVTPPIHVDTIVPTVAITGAPTIEENDPFVLTVTFSEPVNGFAVPASLTVTGPATALASGTEGASVYTVTITPNATSEGDVTVQVNAAGVQDFALNNNTASNTVSVHVDTIVPTVTITGTPDIEMNVPFDLTIEFSEPVNGFTVPADLALTGPITASLTSGGNGDAEYTVTITPNPTAEGDVTVQVNANAVQDFALNNNTASNTVSVHVDTIVPTVTLEDVPVIEKRNDVFDITVIFSEEVNGFEVPADMTLDGPATAAVTAGADGDTEYTVTVTPNPNARGDLTFLVNAAGVRDFALNPNTESEETDAVRIDTAPPVAEITNLPTITGAPFDITITFNEQVMGFATEDIALTGPATAVLKSGVDGDEVYIATITPDANAKGDVRIQIPAGVVKDLALNENIASEITPAIHVDTNALTVQITDVPETVQLEAFSVMIKFSMDVADFVLTDITISGDAVIQTSELSGRGSVYALKITPETDTDGDVIIQVPADVATDAASNRNAASIPQTVSVAPNWMPDGSLRDAAREVLGLDAGEDFERAELRKLTTLTVESSDVSTLTGLETATDLTALDLSGNAITDISLLQDLTKLTTLDLSGNAITDMTALGNFTALTTLDLSGNAITDITALAELTELTVLDLGGNAITDITTVGGLTKLTTLNLSDNPISSLNPLATLTSLTTLGVAGNSISDLTVISGLTGLLTLNIGDNAITDITLIGNLTALTSLDLSGNTVSTLTPLTTLTQLTTLKLNNNTVSDLTALGGLTTLTTLELAGNTISTLTPIATLQQLRVLDLSDNTITDVSTLASLASLTTLRLMGNPILDTTALYALTQRVPPVDIDIAVSQYTPWDVNADGSVDAADSALVTAALGQTGDGILDPRTDVNGDGTVDNADLLLVTGNFDAVPGAPTVADILRLLDPATVARLDREVLQAELQRLMLANDGSLKYRRAIELLQRVLAAKQPGQTRLFANYPNPFNPETWIPYQLAIGSNVEITIYDVKGIVVRHLKLGHQAAGYYTEKPRAAYWNGRNAVGERVASGVYFYQLQADNVSLLRKMVILK